MGITQDALFGTNYGPTMGATMMNPSAASGDTDWGAVLLNGIRGAAQGAIASQVQGAYSSGQLQGPMGQPRGNSMMPLLIIAAIVYAVAH
jgi:hypothetical protein